MVSSQHRTHLCHLYITSVGFTSLRLSDLVPAFATPLNPRAHVELRNLPGGIGGGGGGVGPGAGATSLAETNDGDDRISA